MKLKGIDGGPHKRRNMWFNSMIREEPSPQVNGVTAKAIYYFLEHEFPLPPVVLYIIPQIKDDLQDFFKKSPSEEGLYVNYEISL